MVETSEWSVAEPTCDAIFKRFNRPLKGLAEMDVAALVLRRAAPPDSCEQIVNRLIERDLLFDPQQPIPDSFRDRAIPEGYYREGKDGAERHAWETATQSGSLRIDIGTSLGYRGSDREAFFRHSRETETMFHELFQGGLDPIQLVYRQLERIAIDQRVVTAYEPDGRRYGPAIIRAHYGGYTYKPHFDSVRYRENRTDYAVHAFSHQFAGVLVLQNAHLADRSAHAIIHRARWEPELDPYLANDTFHEYAARQQIPNVEVTLEAGDLYFFNTRCIHEVPGMAGPSPRIVLATFIGYSQDRNEIFVWS